MQSLGVFRFPTIVRRALGALVLLGVVSMGASAATTERVIHAFTGGNDGGNPAAAVIFDAAGDAYGTTVVGGTSACGTVFEMKQSGGRWAETVLYNFSCYGDGKNPYGGVVLDGAGNLYGTTAAGGSGPICSGDGCGTVFEVTAGGEKVLHNFAGGTDGFGPGGGLVFDKNGNLFGTTPDGGTHSLGTVFELSPSGSTWQYRVIHNFSGGKDGAVGSLGALLADGSGNLYGVTESAGAHSAGTVFRLAPGHGGGWQLTTLYSFKGVPDAGFPYGGLIADASGTLYGTTYYGGATGAGAVFALAPNKKRGWTERVLYSFTGGADGGSPTSTLNFDGAGDLFGTASAGGNAGCGCGVAFSLSAGTWHEHVVHAFAGDSDGAYPYYGFTPGPRALLYATTASGGHDSQGTVFALKP